MTRKTCIVVFGGKNDTKYELYDKPFMLKIFYTIVFLHTVSKHENGCKAIFSGSDLGRHVGWSIGADAPPKKTKCLKRFSFDFDITLV